jgi:hypothetical protein
VNFKHARDTTDALARIFALATPPGASRTLAERGGAEGG